MSGSDADASAATGAVETEHQASPLRADPPSAAALQPSRPLPPITRGTCLLTFAADIGFAIDLERAATLLPGGADRTQIRERRTPSHLNIEPPPLRVQESVPSLRIGAWSTSAQAECTLYDFGGATITFRIPLEGPLERLVDLSSALYENRELAEAARAGFRSLLERVRPAVHRPELAPVLEDYAIFQIESLAAPVDPQALLREHAALLAAILRGEPGPLSEQEIAEALSKRSAYRPSDLLIVDWNAAFAIDDDFEAIATVLQFANVELVELRTLDATLDQVVNRAYEAAATHSFRDRLGIGPSRKELRRIAHLEMDAAIVFEQVNNALKLVGDEYLARVHRLAAQRQHTADWDTGIARKLQTVDQIYSRIAERQASRRIELLEWIIILLIAWEVVWAVVR